MHGITCRSETYGIEANLVRAPNPSLFGAVAVSAGLQLATQLFPATRRLLGLSPVGLGGLFGIAGVVVGSTIANRLIGYLVHDELGPRPSA